jgi:hypothetical protein
MATTHTALQPGPTSRFISKLRDYYTLTKPEVNLLILMTTSAGYYLASRGPFRITGLINTLMGTLLVASGTATLNQWMERVWDGSDAPHRQPAAAFGQAECARGISVWDSDEHRRRLVPCRCGQRASGFSRDLDIAVVSAYRYSVEAEDAAVHAARCVSGCHACPDRVGGCLGRYRAARLVSFRHSISVAVPAFLGDCLDVP